MGTKWTREEIEWATREHDWEEEYKDPVERVRAITKAIKMSEFMMYDGVFGETLRDRINGVVCYDVENRHVEEMRQLGLL